VLNRKFKVVKLGEGDNLPQIILFSHNSQVQDIAVKLLRERRIQRDSILYSTLPTFLRVFWILFSKLIFKTRGSSKKFMLPLAAIVFDKQLLEKIGNLNTPLDIISKHFSSEKLHLINISKEVRLTLNDVVIYMYYFLRALEFRPIKFAIVGTSGILVNEAVLWFLVSFKILPVYLASPIAIELSIINNFILNDIWTFRRYRSGSFILRLFKYHIAVAIGGIINYVILLTLTFLGVYFLLANLVGIFMGYVANYLLSEVMVWK